MCVKPYLEILLSGHNENYNLWMALSRLLSWLCWNATVWFERCEFMSLSFAIWGQEETHAIVFCVVLLDLSWVNESATWCTNWYSTICQSASNSIWTSEWKVTSDSRPFENDPCCSKMRISVLRCVNQLRKLMFTNTQSMLCRTVKIHINKNLSWCKQCPRIWIFIRKKQRKRLYAKESAKRPMHWTWNFGDLKKVLGAFKTIVVLQLKTEGKRNSGADIAGLPGRTWWVYCHASVPTHAEVSHLLLCWKKISE